MKINLLNFINKAESVFPGESEREKRIQAERIISSVLGIKPVDIYTSGFKEITSQDIEAIESCFERRKSGEPLQYILGHAHFRNLEIMVGTGVLIPRPETEELVGIVLDRIGDSNPFIVDVGTGSGAIALSIAQECPASQVLGVDISPEAVSYAVKNREHNNVHNAKFMLNNLLEGFNINCFDAVVSNLPYVTDDEFFALDQSVRCYEPELALRGGKDGLDLIRILVAQSGIALKQGGRIFLEFGHRQGDAVGNLLEADGRFRNIEIVSDFNGIRRFAIAELHSGA